MISQRLRRDMAIYEGSFHTAKLSGSERTELLRNINHLIRWSFDKIGENPGLISVGGYGSLNFPEIEVLDKYPNLFLPEEDWAEINYTSFDTVIAYLLYGLNQFGYLYNGTVRASAPDRLWKLVAHDSKVEHVDGEFKLIYNEKTSYQVGGFKL